MQRVREPAKSEKGGLLGSTGCGRPGVVCHSLRPRGAVDASRYEARAADVLADPCGQTQRKRDRPSPCRLCCTHSLCGPHRLRICPTAHFAHWKTVSARADNAAGSSHHGSEAQDQRAARAGVSREGYIAPDSCKRWYSILSSFGGAPRALAFSASFATALIHTSVRHSSTGANAQPPACQVMT
eukprot:6206995-Pleurochrysis_carterae.AAC.2